jgi:phage terminase large subunit-like protein
MPESPSSKLNSDTENRLTLLEELNQWKTERSRRQSRRKIDSFFPDTGPLRRELYPVHMEIFAKGKTHRERMMLAGNRIGKTEGCGCYELTLHLTGIYPKWWIGRTFDYPINAWAAGKDSKTVREILQHKLLGPQDALGTGMVPGDSLVSTSPKPGVPDGIETVQVRHRSGGLSRLMFKSFDQGRESFVGTEQHLVWLDEEPSYDLYFEALTRTMTTNGLMLVTMTPLYGMTDLIKYYMGYQEVVQ